MVKQVSLVINIVEGTGFSAVRLPDEYVMPPITVEQQLDGKTGPLFASSDVADLAKCINGAVKEVTGTLTDVLRPHYGTNLDGSEITDAH